MQRQNFSSNIFIEYTYEKEGLIRKTVSSGLLCSDKVIATALASTVRSFIIKAHFKL